MSVAEKCQQCGGLLAKSEVPFGAGAVCPRCLLGLGMSDPEVTQAVASGSPGRFRAPDVDQLVGKFPDLEIQHLIGYGGMGAVYQARQTTLDRPVALKILAPSLSRDEAFAQRFMREARTLARLSHPNIVMVFDFGKASNFHYLLMEYVDGINLRDAILEKTLHASEALAIVPQICDALQYAHDEGVVHRDIKPENILIDRKGRVKIADFGLAKLLQADATEMRLTGTQQVLGTLNYMAPEQIEGRESIDHRADIYSLGVVFYELLTGELPIGRFAVPSEKVGVSHQLDEVVLRTLEKEPGRRYQQASEVRTAIQAATPVPGVAADDVALPVEVVEDTFGKPPAKPGEAAATANPKAAAYNTAAFNRPVGYDHQAVSDLDISLPFTIDQMFGGFASAFGLMRVLDGNLELEYEVRDEIFQTIRAKSKQVLIPLANLSSVQFIRGLTGDRMEFQAKSLAATDDVPNARSGSFTLKTRKNVRENAEAMAHWIQRQLDPGSGVVPRVNDPVGQPTVLERAVQPFRGLLRWQPTREEVRPLDVSTRFSSVRFWFITCGVINFLMIGGNLRRVAHNWCQEFLEDLPQRIQVALTWMDLAANPFSDKFVEASNGWSIIGSILLFVAAGKLDQLKGFPFVAILCGILLIPVYPLYIVLAPWALWCLLQMMRPSTIAVFEDCQSCDTTDGGVAAKEPVRVNLSGQKFIGRFLTASLLLLFGGLIGTTMLVSAWVRGPEVPDATVAPAAQIGNEDGDSETEESANTSRDTASVDTDAPSSDPQAQESEEGAEATDTEEPETDGTVKKDSVD